MVVGGFVVCGCEGGEGEREARVEAKVRRSEKR
jgi:hypothetical protein